MNPFKSSIAGIALALASVAIAGPAAAAGGDAPQIQQAGGISHVSGGVSEEERAMLDGMARDFNIKMIFATRGGEYLSDTEVVVSGRGQPVLQTKSNGPWFFARLPAGQYQVTATSNGRAQRRSVTVGGRGLRAMDFRWESLEGDRIRR